MTSKPSFALNKCKCFLRGLSFPFLVNSSRHVCFSQNTASFTCSANTASTFSYHVLISPLFLISFPHLSFVPPIWFPSHSSEHSHFVSTVVSFRKFRCQSCSIAWPDLSKTTRPGRFHRQMSLVILFAASMKCYQEFSVFHKNYSRM